MSDLETYLLRTRAGIESFREKYRNLIDAKSGLVERWFNSLPLHKWQPLRLRAGQEEAVIGILSLLYIGGRINITFSSDMKRIRRDALTLEEFLKNKDSHSDQNDNL